MFPGEFNKKPTIWELSDGQSKRQSGYRLGEKAPDVTLSPDYDNVNVAKVPKDETSDQTREGIIGILARILNFFE